MKKSDIEHSTKVDVDSTTSEHSGLKGLLETILRRFRTATFMIALFPVYLLAVLIMAISATPAVYFFNFMQEFSATFSAPLNYFFIALALIGGFFIYGFSLIFVAPFFNLIIPIKMKPFRGPYYSLRSVPWFVHNTILYVVRYTFLEFITPTPLNILFYRMMGMKIGKGVHLNTTNISDAALIELEDKVTIGGSVHIICHYAAKGFLVIAPVKIRKGATLGLKATVMGDVEIGENAVIAPHEVVYPKSRVAADHKPAKAKSINGLSLE
ncbi:MAG: hypothetical protein H6627_12020 [Calditrichae bacterium]|nr:hypothetical protein [Calditrichota bacterium]MCB9059287.1 hypothetical protein [Calditrichia bacterium]